MRKIASDQILTPIWVETFLLSLKHQVPALLAGAGIIPLACVIVFSPDPVFHARLIQCFMRLSATPAVQFSFLGDVHFDCDDPPKTLNLT